MREALAVVMFLAVLCLQHTLGAASYVGRRHTRMLLAGSGPQRTLLMGVIHIVIASLCLS